MKRSSGCKHEGARVDCGARRVGDERIENRLNSCMNAGSFCAREQSWMRRDADRADRVQSVRVEHAADRFFARWIRNRVRQTYDDRIATVANKLRRSFAHTFIIRFSQQLAARGHAFFKRDNSRCDRLARCGHTSEEIASSLIANFNDAFKPCTHKHADSRATTFEQRVGAARCREPNFKRRQWLVERCRS